MQELAPSPIEDDEADYYYNAEQIPMNLVERKPTDFSASNYSNYSQSSSNLAFWLARSQKYSSYAFSAFLGLHATTVSLTPLFMGLDAGNSSLLLARTYFYQSHPIVESILIPGSLLLHVGSGLGLRAYRHYQQRKRYGGSPPPMVSQWRLRNFSGVSLAGWAVLPFVAAHTGLLRAVPLWVDGGSSDITLEYLGHGFRMGRWGKWIGTGFYTVMVGLVSYHVVFGWAKYLKIDKRRQRITGATAVAVAGTWLSGLFVIAQSGPVRGYLGKHYDHLYNVFFMRAV